MKLPAKKTRKKAKTIRTIKSENEIFAFMGDLRTGQVLVHDDIYTLVYVTIAFNGQVIKVRNYKEPMRLRLPIKIGFPEGSKTMQVLGRWEGLYPSLDLPYVPPHPHTWGKTENVAWIRKEQILELLPAPIGGLSIRVNSGNYRIGNEFSAFVATTFDMTSYVPTTGAKWVVVSIDIDGNLDYTEGDEVLNRGLLTITNLPAIPDSASRYILFGCKVYADMSEFIYAEYDTDIFDPRFTHGIEMGSMKYRGEWDALSNYNAGDVVSISDLYDVSSIVYSDSLLYLCFNPSTSNRPPNDNYWIPMGGSGSPTPGGGGTPGGNNTEVQFNDGGNFGGDANLTWDKVARALGIGDASKFPIAGLTDTLWMVGDGVSPSIFSAAFGASNAPYLTGIKADGTAASPTNIKADQVIWRFRGRGYDGSAWTDTRAEIRIVADGDWGSGDTPTRIELWTCPDGSGTLTLAMTIGSDGNINIASGKEYRVNGANHTHDGWTSYSAVTPTRIASALDGTFTVTIASPGVFTKTAHGLVLGQKLRLTTTGALPTGLSTGTDYYVIPVSANTFYLATSLANAKLGTAINTSGTQSGTHSIVCNLDPVYRLQFAGVDLSSTLREGMPIKWTQNSIVRYGFICSVPTYASSNTTFHVLTRCDSTSGNYDVLDTGIYTISNFAYALPKVFPVGFPQLPEYWTLEMSDGSAHTASGTTAGTAYNPDGLSLLAPIGAWKLEGQHTTWIEFTGTGQRFSCFGGISTTTTSITDIELSFYFLAASNSIIAHGSYMSKNIHITTPTTYHNMVSTSTSGATAIKIGGTIPAIVRVTSLYV